MAFDLDHALRYLIAAEGSDLHLKVPSYPLIRLHGHLEAIPGTANQARLGVNFENVDEPLSRTLGLIRNGGAFITSTDGPAARAGVRFGDIVLAFNGQQIGTAPHALKDHDPFTRFATAGLAILFGTQSAINMAVNLHLIPAKGMTLPFISYGGSSMISLAYGMGMLLALTRERPRAAMIEPTERLPPEWKTA